MLFNADILDVFGEVALLKDTGAGSGLHRLPLGINRVFRCNLLREQLVIVVFVQHSLHVELLAVSQLLAYLARVNGLHIDIDLGGLCPGELGLLPLLFKIRLLHIAQRPERVELNLDLRDLIHFTGGEAGLEDDRQQITQVALEHPALNSFDIVVVVLHAGVIGGTHASDGLAE